MINPARRGLAAVPRTLAVLGASMIAWGLGEGLFIFFLPLILQTWQFDPAQTGAVLSAIGVLMALVQVPAGYLADRFGPRPVIFGSLLLGVISAALMALAHTRAVFLLGLFGYSMTSLIVAPINSYVTAQRGSWSPQRAMTFVSGGFQVGAIAGPLLGGSIGQVSGIQSVFGYSAGLFLLSTIIAIFARRVPPQADPNAPAGSAAGRSLLANPRFLLLLGLIILTIAALSTPQQLASLYLQEVHSLSLQQIGITGTLAGISTAVMMFALGGLRAPVGMIAGQVFIAVFALLLWRGQSAAVFYSAYLLLGGYRLYRSMALAQARTLVKSGTVGLAYGLVETAAALAVIAAPLAAGFLYEIRPSWIFIASIAALAVTALLTALLGLRQHAANPEA